MFIILIYILLEFPGECIKFGMVEFGVELPGGLPDELWLGVPWPNKTFRMYSLLEHGTQYVGQTEV